MMRNKFSIGMNMHNFGSTAYNEVHLKRNLDYCAELGINTIRFNNVSHTVAEREKVKIVATECHNRGMDFVLVIDDNIYRNYDTKKVEEFYERYLFKIATDYKGYVDAYQILNEPDVAAMHGDIANMVLPGKDGKEKGEYDSVILENAILAVRGGIAGIKKADPDVPVSTNFGWWHTAPLYEMHKQGCKFDLIGIDWYSDQEEVSNICDLVNDVENNIPDIPIMLYETNYWMHPISRDPLEKQMEIKIKVLRESRQAEWVPKFFKKIYDMSLKDPRISGIIFYELLDEPIITVRNGGDYCGEANFGFISCEKNGENAIKKPVFEALKKAINETVL